MFWRRFLPEKLTVAQLFIQFPVFHRTRQSITIFTTAQLTPSHLIPLAHLPSVLTHILHWSTSLLWPICLVHFNCNADIPKWGTKKVRLTNYLTPNLTYESQIGTNNTWCSYNFKPHQPYPTLYILNSNNQTINSVHNNKHNPQTKPSALNWHNQNPNITTVQMLMVLLQ